MTARRSVSPVGRAATIARGSVALFALALLLVTGAARDAAAVDWRSIEVPGSAGTTPIMVEGRTFQYERFTSETPLRFVAEGPTRLKVIMRLRVPTATLEGSFAVELREDGAVVDSATYETESAGPDATYLALEDFVPGQIRRLYIDVPTGAHAYELFVVGPSIVDARVFRTTDDDPPRVSIAPRSHDGVAMLLYKEKELTYYVASEETPVVLEVIGPTTVKVNTRLVLAGAATDDQAYHLGVSTDGGDETIYRLRSQASSSIVFRDRDDALPGALRSFELPLEAGTHSISFRVAEAPGDRLLLKFYIPRGDVENGS